MIFALIGNQNSGKTTLFNQLTGANQHVGNFPGVTVERKEGQIRRQKGLSIVDLPGIYSLSPYTAEEVVTRDFLIKDRPDGIINIVDATNIERNLYLTLQLMELDIPVVLALNMMDEVRRGGGSIDIAKMESELRITVVPIAANKNEGVDALVEQAVKAVEKGPAQRRVDFCKGPLHKCIHSIAHLVEFQARSRKIPVRFAATKIVEGDEPMRQSLGLSESDLHIAEHIVTEMEEELHTDREAALADMRYEFIEELVKECVKKPTTSPERIRSDKIDSILTHKLWSIPLFLGIMLTIFWLTFNVIGARLSDWMAIGIDFVTGAFDRWLTAAAVAPWMHSLLIDGVFAGVGSVLSFLPNIVVLFFFLSLLEDSGYMARVAFVMDKLLRKIGLSGRSFVPMLIGFGCSVPAIMSTRVLASDRDRKMTIMLTPFISCSAKMPIYAVFTAAFFADNRPLILVSLYCLGIGVAIVAGLILSKTLFRGNSVPFVMELPVYRLPSAKSVTLHMWEKAKDFIVKAFSVIFVATIFIWFSSSFDLRFNLVDDSSQSLLAAIGRLAAPIFAPLGFGDWRAATALVIGLTAKEAMISTLAILTGASDSTLTASLTQMFTPISAYSFLCFALLYMPCVAAMAATRREMGSLAATLGVMAFQTATAWVVAFIMYRLISALAPVFGGLNTVDIVLGAIILIALIAALSYIRRRRKKSPCGFCSGCDHCAGCAQADRCTLPERRREDK
ncbi:MAG: ferrous iron transport protein B [Peptococcaceae bacterium]|nr:ferrous iron transport protein B [Peptococcaceae bacterium]